MEVTIQVIEVTIQVIELQLTRNKYQLDISYIRFDWLMADSTPPDNAHMMKSHIHYCMFLQV